MTTDLGVGRVFAHTMTVNTASRRYGCHQLSTRIARRVTQRRRASGRVPRR